MATTEPIIDPKEDRLMYFPVLYPKIVNNYDKQVAAFWTFKEVEKAIVDDHGTINTIPEHIRDNIKGPLLFLAFGDSLISDNISIIARKITIPEIKMTLSYQLHTELAVHNPCYSKMVLPFLGTNKLDSLKEELMKRPCVIAKEEFMRKYFGNKIDETSYLLDGIGIQVLACIINEGLFFSSSFAYIFWCKDNRFLSGLGKVNEFIARDEWLHTQLWMEIFEMIINKPSPREVHLLFKKAVEVECAFADECIKIEVSDMNKEYTYQYIKYVADTLLVHIGYPTIYDVSNPFSFMNKFGMSRMNDFFLSTTTDYKHASTVANIDSDLTFEPL